MLRDAQTRGRGRGEGGRVTETGVGPEERRKRSEERRGVWAPRGRVEVR